jgi:hypothetical protein
LPPRLITKNGGFVSFGGNGTLIFLRLEEKASYLARIQADGSGFERLLDTPVLDKGAVSPDGEWVAVTGAAEGGNQPPGTMREKHRGLDAGSP